MRVKAAIVYYTDHRLDPGLAALCQRQLLAAAGEIPIVTVGLGKACDFGAIRRDVYGERSIAMMHRQILEGIGCASGDYIFLAEHDVIYSPSHFEFIPPRADTFYYNTHVWHVRYPDGHAVAWDDCQQVSGLCASRDLLLSFYTQKLAQIASEPFNRHYEPGLKQTVGGRLVENWQSDTANLDVRHDKNLTLSKWAPSQFRNQRYAKGWREADSVAGWGNIADLFKVAHGTS